MIYLANTLRFVQLWIQIPIFIVDFAHGNPMSSPQRQRYKSNFVLRRHVQNEAEHLTGVYARRMSVEIFVESVKHHSSMHGDISELATKPHTFFYRTTQLRSPSAALPTEWRSHRNCPVREKIDADWSIRLATRSCRCDLVEFWWTYRVLDTARS